MTSISTAGLYNTLLANANLVHTAYSTANEQESTGLVSTTLGGLGNNAGQYLDLQTELAQSQSYSSNASTAGTRTQSMYTAIGDMISQLTTLKTTISSAMSSTDNSTLTTSAESVLDDLASEMNTEVGGNYLFSGAKTDTAAVDISDYLSTSLSTSTADTSYYQGDDEIASVKVSSQESISYGVTADNSAFEQALRAAGVVAQLDTSGGTVDTDTLSSAYELATSALDALSNLQAEVSTSASRLSDAETSQTTAATQLETMSSNISDVDITEAAAQVSTLQAQLEASYSALASVLKVKLTDYL